LGPFEVATQNREAGRVLADEELDREIASVERSGERAHAGLVDLEAENLQHGQLDAVGADGTIVLDVGDHERLRESRRDPLFDAVLPESLGHSSDQGFHGFLLRRFNSAAQG